MVSEAQKRASKKYREANKEKIKEQMKGYYENNKEHIKQKEKDYRENNKEKIKEYRENNKDKIKEKKKEYRENNKEKIKEYDKTDAGIKSHRISKWKYIGVKSDDYNKLYEMYINTTNCEECNIELIEGRYGNNKKCLDHDHTTGEFRNVLCQTCNVRRG